jgi:hypothetical protein
MTQVHQEPETTVEIVPHPSATEARQGVTTHHVRWMLGISLALTVAVIVVAWIVISAGH